MVSHSQVQIKGTLTQGGAFSDAAEINGRRLELEVGLPQNDLDLIAALGEVGIRIWHLEQDSLGSVVTELDCISIRVEIQLRVRERASNLSGAVGRKDPVLGLKADINHEAIGGRSSRVVEGAPFERKSKRSQVRPRPGHL